MTHNNVFSLKELVQLGTLNAVLLVLSYSVIMALHFIPPLWGFIDPIVNFLIAPVYLLMLRLVPKIPVMTIHGTVIGIFHMMTGWWPGLFAGIIGGLLADGASYLLGGYRRPRAIYVSVLVFATLKTFIFYLPVYSFVLFPVFTDIVSAWPQELLEAYSLTFAGFVLMLNLAGCMVGLRLGKKMMFRHFTRAGALPS